MPSLGIFNLACNFTGFRVRRELPAGKILMEVVKVLVLGVIWDGNRRVYRMIN